MPRKKPEPPQLPSFGSYCEYTETALAAADWITDADMAAVGMLRKIAATLDDPEYPVINGKFDNVSQALYLKTLTALHLTPQARADADKKKKENTGGRLDTLREQAQKYKG